MQFTIRNPAAPKHLHCPTCKASVFIASSGGGATPDGDPWLNDGDTVGALWQTLSDAQQKPSGWCPMLMVGICRKCRATYYVFFATLMDAEYENVEGYLTGETDERRDTYSACEATSSVGSFPNEWLLRENVTQDGVLHEHLFGPFPLVNTAGVVGVNGVSSCGRPSAPAWDHAATVLAELWDDMRRFNRERNACVTAEGAVSSNTKTTC